MELKLIEAKEFRYVPTQEFMIKAALRSFERINVMPRIYVRRIGDAAGAEVYEPAGIMDAAIIQAVVSLDGTIKIPVYVV